ncbi:MAG: hypothetical protein FJ257_04325 [Phycisphaerae bacterium]|nr:hypothetical protein [Phycisphaerae bacterium]
MKQRSSSWRLTTAVLAALCIGSSALAQGAPPPPKGRGYLPLAGFGILAVLGGAVLAISLYPSKRSHQDV